MGSLGGHILLSVPVESLPERCKVPEAADWERRKSSESASAKITGESHSGGVTTRVISLMGEHRKGAAVLLCVSSSKISEQRGKKATNGRRDVG